MNKFILGFAAIIAFATTAADAQTATTFSGKIVDLATYITRDHNMDAMKMHPGNMKSGEMQGDSMHGDTTKSDAASNCPSTLGLVTSAGRIYLLATQMGSSAMQSLCKRIGKATSLSGTAYTQGGMSVLLVK